MQRRFSALCGNGQLKGDTLFQKRVSPFQSPERNFTLAVCSSKSYTRCAIRCGVHGFAMNPYRLVTTLNRALLPCGASDVYSAADCVPNAALLALAAICVLSVDGDYTAPKQDSRAAADDRSTLSRIAGINAALPRAGITFRRQKTCASPRLPIKTLSLGGCKGGYSLSEERE